MTSDETDYLRRRERQERGAAKAAPTSSAGKAHLDLADCYAAVLMRLAGHDPVACLRREGLL